MAHAVVESKLNIKHPVVGAAIETVKMTEHMEKNKKTQTETLLLPVPSHNRRSSVVAIGVTRGIPNVQRS